MHKDTHQASLTSVDLGKFCLTHTLRIDLPFELKPSQIDASCFHCVQVSDWAIDYSVSGGTDREGWQYAADFPAWVLVLIFPNHLLCCLRLDAHLAF